MCDSFSSCNNESFAEILPFQNCKFWQAKRVHIFIIVNILKINIHLGKNTLFMNFCIDFIFAGRWHRVRTLIVSLKSYHYKIEKTKTKNIAHPNFRIENYQETKNPPERISESWISMEISQSSAELLCLIPEDFDRNLTISKLGYLGWKFFLACKIENLFGNKLCIMIFNVAFSTYRRAKLVGG